MNKVTDELLRLVADFKGEFTGAYNISRGMAAPGASLRKTSK